MSVLLSTLGCAPPNPSQTVCELEIDISFRLVRPSVPVTLIPFFYLQIWHSSHVRVLWPGLSFLQLASAENLLRLRWAPWCLPLSSVVGAEPLELVLRLWCWRKMPFNKLGRPICLQQLITHSSEITHCVQQPTRPLGAAGSGLTHTLIPQIPMQKRCWGPEQRLAPVLHLPKCLSKPNPWLPLMHRPLPMYHSWKHWPAAALSLTSSRA